MHGSMNEESDTVEPPMNDNIGPKFGIDCATKRTAVNIEHRIITRFHPKAFYLNIKQSYFIIKLYYK